jgi:hypothetical protein
MASGQDPGRLQFRQWHGLHPRRSQRLRRLGSPGPSRLELGQHGPAPSRRSRTTNWARPKPGARAARCTCLADAGAERDRRRVHRLGPGDGAAPQGGPQRAFRPGGGGLRHANHQERRPVQRGRGLPQAGPTRSESAGRDRQPGRSADLRRQPRRRRRLHGSRRRVRGAVRPGSDPGGRRVELAQDPAVVRRRSRCGPGRRRRPAAPGPGRRGPAHARAPGAVHAVPPERASPEPEPGVLRTAPGRQRPEIRGAAAGRHGPGRLRGRRLPAIAARPGPSGRAVADGTVLAVAQGRRRQRPGARELCRACNASPCRCVPPARARC